MSMKAKHVLCSLGLMASGLVFVGSANGLDYQDNVDVEFTFEPTLSIGLSAQVLKIDDLAPGSTGTSNGVTVTVNSNNVTGYTLSAQVGSSTNTTSDLTVDSNHAFTSLAVGSSVALADFEDSTWGYVIDSGANYSGLADYESEGWTQLKKTITSGDTSTLFQIGAKAAGDQVAGNYTNKINFKVVTNYVPTSGNMQDVAEGDLELLMPEIGDAAMLKDVRDGQQYMVAKFPDGNYWMASNLNLGSTTGTMTLTAADSNVSTSGYTLPQSSATGFSDDTAENVYKSGSTTCSDTSACYSYYTFAAATAGENPSTGSSSYDICPKGWRLPTSTELTEFITAIDGYSGNASAIVSMIYAGAYMDSALSNGGTNGYYWSSDAEDGNDAYFMSFDSDTASVVSGSKASGYSISCMFNL